MVSSSPTKLRLSKQCLHLGLVRVSDGGTPTVSRVSDAGSDCCFDASLDGGSTVRSDSGPAARRMRPLSLPRWGPNDPYWQKVRDGDTGSYYCLQMSSTLVEHGVSYAALWDHRSAPQPCTMAPQPQPRPPPPLGLRPPPQLRPLLRPRSIRRPSPPP